LTSEAVKESEDKETRHIELNFDNQPVDYNPGDVC